MFESSDPLIHFVLPTPGDKASSSCLRPQGYFAESVSVLLQKLKITATETELGECQAIFSAPLSGEELFVWPPQKTSKLFPNFQLVKDAAAKLCGGKPRKVRLTQRDGIGWNGQGPRLETGGLVNHRQSCSPSRSHRQNFLCILNKFYNTYASHSNLHRRVFFLSEQKERV